MAGFVSDEMQRKLSAGGGPTSFAGPAMYGQPTAWNQQPQAQRPNPYQLPGAGTTGATSFAGPARLGQPTAWNQQPQAMGGNPYQLPGAGTTGMPGMQNLMGNPQAMQMLQQHLQSIQQAGTQPQEGGFSGPGAVGQDPRLMGYGQYNQQSQQFTAPRMGQPGYGAAFNPGQVMAQRQDSGRYSMLGQGAQQMPMPPQQSQQQPGGGQPDTATNDSMTRFYQQQPWMMPNPYGHRGGPDQSLISQYSAMPNGENLLRFFQDGGRKQGPMTVAQMQQYGFRR